MRRLFVVSSSTLIPRSLNLRVLYHHAHQPLAGGRHSCFYSTSLKCWDSSKISIPSATATTTWERSAQKVKDVQYCQGDYLDLIRETHDPSLHIKTIEDELQQTIGKALGKQGDKILTAVKKMKNEYQDYQSVLEKSQQQGRSSADLYGRLQVIAEKYNQHRQDALQARWELIVHRQAAGMIVNNHSYVTKMFPIGPALPTHGDEEETHGKDTNTNEQDETASSNIAPPQKFGDQLDWWQRVGRWR